MATAFRTRSTTARRCRTPRRAVAARTPGRRAARADRHRRFGRRSRRRGRRWVERPRRDHGHRRDDRCGRIERLGRPRRSDGRGGAGRRGRGPRIGRPSGCVLDGWIRRTRWCLGNRGFRRARGGCGRRRDRRAGARGRLSDRRPMRQRLLHRRGLLRHRLHRRVQDLLDGDMHHRHQRTGHPRVRGADVVQPEGEVRRELSRTAKFPPEGPACAMTARHAWNAKPCPIGAPRP